MLYFGRIIIALCGVTSYVFLIYILYEHSKNNWGKEEKDDEDRQVIN